MKKEYLRGEGNMKKVGIKISCLVLVLALITVGIPTNTKVFAGKLESGIHIPQENGITFILDTDEKSEYLIEIDGQTLHYIETQKELYNGIVEIETKVYNYNTQELLQDYTTTVDGTSIIEQDIKQYDTIQQQESVSTLDNSIFSRRNIISNKSLVTYLGISYTTNHNKKTGTAKYSRKTKKINLNKSSASTRTNYNKFTRSVDSLRSYENGTIAGWLITAFSSGGLAVGTILSWKTAKVILKNIAGPVAIVTNTYSLTMWLYHYNQMVKNFNGIKK